MKKLLVICAILVLALVGCQKDTLQAKMEGEWLLLERHMVIEFDSEENNYVEFKDTFDLPSQVQSRQVRYSKDDEFELDFEHPNITSIYTQTFGKDYSSVENYVKTEITHYTAEYRENEVFYQLDEEKSNREYVDQYEINGFTNQVKFDGDKMILTMELDAEDFKDDPAYEGVKKITGTMILEPFVDVELTVDDDTSDENTTNDEQTENNTQE